MIKEITPPEAWQILQTEDKAVIIDVRSTMEYEYVGHPVDAVNIPWKEPPAWEITPGFVEKVRDTLQGRFPGEKGVEDIKILALCRSGARSHAAGEALAAGGFKEVYNVLEGFEGDKDGNRHRNTVNGWRVHGLPWEQS